MTVLIVMPVAVAQRGGGQSLLHLMQQGLDIGIVWHVVFLQHGPLVQEVRRLGAEATVIEAGRIREIHRVFSTVRAIARLARSEQAKLILGWRGTGHLYGGLAARIAGIPAAWYQLEAPSGKGLFDRLTALIPARAVFTTSKAVQEAQREFTPSLPCPIVYPAVELHRFNPAGLQASDELRKQLGLPLGIPIIGMVGTLQQGKGMHVLITAMPKVRTRFPLAEAVIVGGKYDLEPEYPDALAQQIRNLGAESYVRMVGSQQNVPEWMQAMDIIVHASNHEPFSIVVVEAMALGKPVVATDAAGPTEIITPGAHGLLTPYGESEPLAKALIRLLENPQEAAAMARAAQIRAQDFSVRRFAENLAGAVRNAIAGNTPEP